MDRPEGDSLKIHSVAIPLSGGIAIFLCFSLLLFFLYLGANLVRVKMAGILVGGSMALLMGVWDDLKPTLPVFRLGFQALSGAVLVFSGSSMNAPFFICLPLSIFYVMGAINAVNMEDGLDGLAGGIALISFMGFAILSATLNRPMDLRISVILCGILIGFLCFNFNPASIFMGDSGSYFIGFILAYFALRFTDLSRWPAFLGPIFIIGAPVFDTAYAILRRMKKGVSPFYGDRSHFYDQLMQRGLSVRQTVLICWGIQAFLVGFGVAIYLSFPPASTGAL